MRFKLWRDSYRVWVMASLMGLLIGANSLIKILRDSIFLGHHSVSELPYLYIMVALIAGLVIAAYTRYTAHISLMRLILATNATILGAILFFWVVLSYFDPAWSHYAFYIWSAMATVIAVAQVWTLANHIFTEQEGKRYFGLIAAGGTAGGIVASFGSRWSVHLSVESNHLLWVVAGIYVIGSLLVIAVESRFNKHASEPEILSLESPQAANQSGIGALLLGSGYLKSIAVIILVSVIVSTLIDFEFKTGVKQTYPSRRELAEFFSLYYGWLNVATLFVQLVLTGRILSKLGLAPSLYLTPGALLAGSLAIIVSPGLLAPTLTRMADIVLRNSVHRSAMEIVYMALPASVVKTVKTFLDVVVERLGDASAGFIILLFSILPLQQGHLVYVHFVCIGLIATWIVLSWFLRARYAASVSQGGGLEETVPKRAWLEREFGG